MPVLDCRISDGSRLPTQSLDRGAAVALARNNEAREMTFPIVPPLPGDPMMYSQVQLVAMGAPPRPDPVTSPELYNTWLAIVSTPKRRVLSGIAPHVGNSNARADTIWSGTAILPPAGTQFEWVQSQWTVPTIASPQLGYSYTASSSIWAGIDGASVSPASIDVLQAGTWQQVHDEYNPHYGGLAWTAYDYHAWIEWFPAYDSTVPLTIHPGDLIYTEVWIGDVYGNYDVTGSYCWAYIYNVATGLFWENKVSMPSGTTFYGDVAEWIIERPMQCSWFFGTTCGHYPLANFGSATMTAEAAYATNGSFYDFTNAPATTYWMQDSLGVKATATDYLFPLSIQFSWLTY